MKIFVCVTLFLDESSIFATKFKLHIYACWTQFLFPLSSCFQVFLSLLMTMSIVRCILWQYIYLLLHCMVNVIYMYVFKLCCVCMFFLDILLSLYAHCTQFSSLHLWVCISLPTLRQQMGLVKNKNCQSQLNTRFLLFFSPPCKCIWPSF